MGGFEEIFSSKQFDQIDQVHVQLIRVHWLSFKTGRRTLKAQWSLYIPPSLTYKTSTFIPHCIYVFCVYLRTNSDYFPI
jgi:hypothetical protein